jgi:hypothetical protein
VELMDGLKIDIPGSWTGDVSSLPLLLPGLPVTPTARFAASDLALADGGNVASWSDRLGGAPLTLTGTAPTRQTVSAEPVVRFAGGATRLLKAYAPTTPLTVFMFEKINVLEINKYLAGVSSSTAAGDIAISGSTKYQIYGTSAVSSASATATTAWSVLAYVFNGASSAIYLNGTSVATGDPVKTGGTNFSIGHGSAAAQFDLSEVLLYESALTAAQIASVTSAMRTAHPSLA